MLQTKKNTKKLTCIGLLILAILLFLVYIPSNLSGASNPEELSVFESDEFAQYPYLLQMLSPGEGSTVLEVLHTFAVYGHYYYGYPFYFFSALATLPLKILLGSNWTNSTALIVMVLRQSINVLPMILAVLILVWMQTRFESFWKSILLFLLLISFPAVVDNNVWWHPDSLLVLFCVFTLFCLQKDDLRFGKNFYLSAIACGLAVGTKVFGLLFFTTYLAYILYAFIERKVTFLQSVRHGLLFLLVMCGSLVVSNPLLLLPIERNEIFAVFKSNLVENTQGFWVTISFTEKMTAIHKVFISGYGGWIMVGFSFIACCRGLLEKRTRLTNMVLLTWSLTYCAYFILFSSTIRSHYFLPALIPLFSVITQFWPARMNDPFRKLVYLLNPTQIKALLRHIVISPLFLVFPQFLVEKTGKLSHETASKHKPITLRPFLEYTTLTLIMIFIAGNGIMMARQLKTTQNKEVNSPSIEMFKEVDGEYLQKLPDDLRFVIYRDWKAYVEPRSNWRLQISWDLMDYDRLQEDDPDILFLESENINYFADESKLAIALNSKTLKAKYEFYSDAKKEAIRGYTLIYEAAFGQVYARNDVYLEYFVEVD